MLPKGLAMVSGYSRNEPYAKLSRIDSGPSPRESTIGSTCRSVSGRYRHGVIRPINRFEARRNPSASRVSTPIASLSTN